MGLITYGVGINGLLRGELGGMLCSLRSSLDNRLTIVNSSSVAANSIKSRFMITFLLVNNIVFHPEEWMKI